MPRWAESTQTFEPDLGEQQHVTLERRLDADDGRQRFVVDDDELGGVLALVGSLGDDDRDRLADVADDVERERALRERGRERRRLGRQPEVGRGEDAEHAGRAHRLARVDRPDARVGHRGAHVRDVDRALEERVAHVGDERVRPVRMAGILLAQDPVAEDAHRRASGTAGRAGPGARARRCRTRCRG